MSNKAPSKTTVLLADSDVLARLAIAEYLRACGFVVIEASGADEAKLVLLKGPPIDILFADAELADVEGGFGLARWTRRYRRAVSIMLIAGLAKKAEVAERLCPPHCSPPYSSDGLLLRIQSLKGKAKRSEGLRMRASKVTTSTLARPRKRTGS